MKAAEIRELPNPKARWVYLLAILLALLSACTGAGEADSPAAAPTSEKEAAPTSEKEAAPTSEEEAAPDVDRCDEPVDEELDPVRIGVITQLTSLSERVAEAYCIFQQHGLEPELINGTVSTALMQGLLADEYDYIVAPPGTIFPGIANGACLAAVIPTQLNQYNVIARPDWSDIESDDPRERIAATAGLTVGIPARGSALEAVYARLLIESGETPDAVAYVGSGVGAQAITSLRQGTVDVLLSFPPIEQELNPDEFVYVAEFVGQDEHLLSDLVNTYMATSCENAEENPEQVEAYCQAVREAQGIIRDPNRDDNAIAQIMVNYNAASDIDSALTVLDVYSSSIPEPQDAVITESVWNRQADFIPSGPAPSYSDHVAQSSCAE